jgi:phage gpG-like protein
MRVTFDDGGVAAALAKVAARARSARPGWQRAVALVLERARLNFRRGQAGDGARWRPLADGSGRTPLRRSGRLQASISASAGPGGAQVMAFAPYAAFHQLGTRNIPARPFLTVGQADLGRIEEELLAYVIEPAEQL